MDRQFSVLQKISIKTSFGTGNGRSGVDMQCSGLQVTDHNIIFIFFLPKKILGHVNSR